MLSILANENVPAVVVDALRTAGHDVLWARQIHPGKSDRFLCEIAQQENRLLLTLDKDFGELAFRLFLGPPGGIILVRTGTLHPTQLAATVRSALDQPISWAGNFAVIERQRIRITPLPYRSG
jgi:predicted nuclease of predicted toxin-antitoxin system